MNSFCVGSFFQYKVYQRTLKVCQIRYVRLDFIHATFFRESCLYDASSLEPDQIRCPAASDSGIHCFFYRTPGIHGMHCIDSL